MPLKPYRSTEIVLAAKIVKEDLHSARDGFCGTLTLDDGEIIEVEPTFYARMMNTPAPNGLLVGGYYIRQAGEEPFEQWVSAVGFKNFEAVARR